MTLKMVCVYLIFWYKKIRTKLVFPPHHRFHKMQPGCLACSVLCIATSGHLLTMRVFSFCWLTAGHPSQTLHFRFGLHHLFAQNKTHVNTAVVTDGFHQSNQPEITTLAANSDFLAWQRRLMKWDGEETIKTKVQMIRLLFSPFQSALLTPPTSGDLPVIQFDTWMVIY